jgi:alkanesulfonate monooxygenase SsuD/methylene tetrahydromethanopterin reductase-like flavin-dependent oxidoreductase (luciferase family)
VTVIGFHCSHEQIHPAQLLRDVRTAQEAGFAAAMSSDHFSPWSRRQGHSGFAWSWLGAALATTDLPFGVVNAPGQRYHPAIIAQAAATLAAMFPGRIWVALGSGEASNEHITGEVWPRKQLRDARRRECVLVIRALLDGQEVSHDGLVTVDRARLWTLPERPPDLVGPAVSVASARSVAEWADGLVTVNAHLSWAPDPDEAMATAREQWRSNAFAPPACWDIDTAELFDAVSEHVPDEMVRDSVLVSHDLARHAQWLFELVELGFDELYLHHVGQQQSAFIEAFGRDVLPQLRTEPAVRS